MAASPSLIYHVRVTTTPAKTTHSYLALCNMVYWLALMCWVGVLIAAGVAATATFTTLPDPELGVTLERFAAFDSTEHGRIAAGLVMEPVFTFVDLLQIVAAFFVLITLVVQLLMLQGSWRWFSNLIRMLCIAVAVGLFAWRTFTITPEMNSNLRAYWNAAEAGQIEIAENYRSAFDAQHGTASALFRGTLFALVIAVGASAVTLGPRVQREDHSKLERPKLAL